MPTVARASTDSGSHLTTTDPINPRTPAPNAVLPLCYRAGMAIRRKRSISIPPVLDDQIQAEATREGITYSAWLAETARKELTIRAGLAAAAEVERELGGFSDEELADAQQWAAHAVARGAGGNAPSEPQAA